MTSSFSLSTAHDDIEDAAALARRRVNLVSRNLAETEAQRTHWLERVRAAGSLGTTEHALALRLARTDRRVPRGLEVCGFAAQWGRDIGLADGDAVSPAIARLETSGLVDVVERGMGQRQWRLILRFSAQHHQEALAMANELLKRHLATAV